MKLAIVGVGKLGLSLLEGLTRRGVVQGSDIGLLDINAVRVQQLSERFGARVLTPGDLAQVGRIALCLQPRTFPGAVEWLAQPNTGYLSTMAGVSVATLSRRLGTRRVVRAMPSLAATIGKAQTAITAPKEAVDAGDLDFARSLFGAVGDVYELPEHLFNTFTGMSASGPAYAAVFAEGLADGAVRMGLSRPLAQELAAKLLIASGELLLGRAHPGLLKDEVASPGGTTIAGLAELERGAVRSALIEAVVAATKRGAELGKDDEQ
ncbi:pyrroline-5-carboxylate reductase [Deinococcus peraridilitoris]|uniref:Pyrroline-5-carboxylate reductase n=1 Tax=Deinococcus peraridilitoris (strain DSM 19664 / LMG 22246 / CIP 109416 / KR-200) TaxID=937777 RepID=L0A6R1_DEIPD|nr:pyrroline-5-carboxylate reductase [Deinococcus peraridilitoris]AFZ68877.1 pyrroline-5-carboxylate reductase [Deinococcus peraridilitoris DSM 19664]